VSPRKERNHESNGSLGSGSAPAAAQQQVRLLLSLGANSEGLGAWAEGNYGRRTSVEM